MHSQKALTFVFDIMSQTEGANSRRRHPDFDLEHSRPDTQMWFVNYNRIVTFLGNVFQYITTLLDVFLGLKDLNRGGGWVGGSES